MVRGIWQLLRTVSELQVTGVSRGRHQRLLQFL